MRYLTAETAENAEIILILSDILFKWNPFLKFLRYCIYESMSLGFKKIQHRFPFFKKCISGRLDILLKFGHAGF